MNWTFVAAYTIEMLYDLVCIFIGSNAKPKTLLQINILVYVGSIYLPIGVVFLNHLKNILSVNRIFWMFWRDDDIDSLLSDSKENSKEVVTVLLLGKSDSNFSDLRKTGPAARISTDSGKLSNDEYRLIEKKLWDAM